jgi:hypothetical protein
MDTERADHLRNAALAALGPADFDRLVLSVAGTRQLGRLRYWQEQLLARIPGGTVGFEGFIAAFDGAPLQRPPAQAPAEVEGTRSQPDWMKDAPIWVQEGRQLNESEWLAGPHLIWMVSYLLHEHLDRVREDRRHILFGCACCRGVWDLIQSDAARHLVHLAEQYADGEISEVEFKAGNDPALFADLEPHYRGLGGPGQLSARAIYAIGGARELASDNYRKSHGAYGVAQETSREVPHDFIPTPQRPMSPKGGCVPPDHEELREKIILLRDIFGNPFRPVTVDPSWRTATVLSLATVAYNQRQLPEGILDPDRLAILADGLEDAGCTDADLLAHLHSPGPHVRGCWAVDLVLAK